MILSTFETIDWANKRGHKNFVSVDHTKTKELLVYSECLEILTENEW